MSLLEDNFPAGEKILADIENVFKNDPELEDFFIIPLTENQNKSPVIHANHSLGLESWCVQHVYCYVYGRLMNHKTRKKREEHKSVVRMLRGALLINPETTTFWNMSKQLIDAERISPEEDLRFSAVVLSFKPKCSEVFTHRKWVLRKIIQQPDVQPFTIIKLLQAELRVTQSAASKYPSNYNAWNHRKWVLEFLVPKGGDGKEVLKQELKQSHWWTSNHVSDFSGLQYRQFIMQKIFESFSYEDYLTWSDWSLEFPGQMDVRCCISCAAAAILEQELQSSTDLLIRFEGHESLWYHRRFILISLQKVCTSVLCVKLDLSVFTTVIISEYSFSNNLACDSQVPHQKRHAKQHSSWINNALGISPP
ncbi:protein prenyltransferase alpha subunit repeat-containing protein 1 [Neocloeon triangulifer]|uniref:protein prenyltransferase alpha subunit repeat-containing protein 1 n=1 Tax=Neocloeon triangulifer TaxID=2078957 RepID=UPI00286EF807|nr:protein prenyltransferase alpha subunit repeat-containing protein 1 [Neocloeon triangulifer]XP_059487432.1 protein prenyltransferase alpha subunit repeat-containing protein 1 [Neocloeon triangulifer]